MPNNAPLFTDEQPEIGSPEQIAWCFDGTGNVQYSLLYTFDLGEPEISAIGEFVTQHQGITGAAAFPGHPNRAVITCNSMDETFAALLWLQEAFAPYTPYTALARVFVAVEPMVASIAFVGDKPDSYEGLIRDLLANEEIDRAHYDFQTDTVVVIFHKLANVLPATDDDDAALAQTFLSTLLGAQWYAAVTIIVNRTDVPVDRAAIEKADKTDE